MAHHILGSKATPRPASSLIVEQTKVPAQASIDANRFLSEEEVRKKESRRLQELLALREELKGAREVEAGGSTFGRVFVQAAGPGTVAFKQDHLAALKSDLKREVDTLHSRQTAHEQCELNF